MKNLRFFIALTMAWLLIAGPVYGALTVDNWTTISLGNKRMKIAQVDFDSSYASGGESFDYTAYGFISVDSVRITGQNGYTFDYDYTNKKIKAFTNAPAIVYDEKVQVNSSRVGTLRYPAAYIIYVSANHVPLKVIPGGLTPVKGTVSVSEPVWGTRNTLTFAPNDAVYEHCNVSYVTQAWKDVFDNYVLATMTAGSRVTGHADLVFNAATPDEIWLGEHAIAIQSVLWSDAGVYKPMDPILKDSTAVTTETTINWSAGAVGLEYEPQTNLEFLQTDTVDTALDTVYIQYIRKPTSGATSGATDAFLADHFVEQRPILATGAAIAVSGATSTITGFTAPDDTGNMLLWGTCGALPSITTYFQDLVSASEAPSNATVPSDNVSKRWATGSGHSIFLPAKGVVAARTFVGLSYVYGIPSEIPGLVPLEVVNGADLSDITNLRIEIIGW